MEPSFLALFKRGRFFRSSVSLPADADEKTANAVRKTRKEQERYTAAALAFCFKHDPKFRQHFWEKVCFLDGDVQFPDSARIEIEPPAWADLLVRSESGGKKFIHVIECKVEADLEAHQDPRNEEFSGSDGYGFDLVEHAAGKATLRYIVLGFREDLKLPQHHSSLPIKLAQRRWEDLELDCPSTPLVDDLLDSLGDFGVGKFRMRTTKNIRVTSGLESVGRVWEVLRATAENLQLVDKYCSTDGGRTGESEWSMGTHVLALPEKKHSSVLQRKLKDLTHSVTSYLAWFGYASSPVGGMKREVWFYCDTDKRAKWLKAQLGKAYPHARLDSDDEQDCVALSDLDRAELNDVEWFSEALGAAGRITLKK
jgi:hypothetical protein